MGTINTSMHAVQQAQDDLSELDALPPLGQDMVRVIQHFFFKEYFLFFNIYLFGCASLNCSTWDL